MLPRRRLVSPVRWIRDIMRVGILAPSSCCAMNSSLSVTGFSAGSKCSLIGGFPYAAVVAATILANGNNAHRRLLVVSYDEARRPGGLVGHLTAFNARRSGERR